MRLYTTISAAALCLVLAGAAMADTFEARKQAADERHSRWVAERRTSETRSAPTSGSVTRDTGGGWKEEVSWQSRPARWPFEYPDRNGNITIEQRRQIPPPAPPRPPHHGPGWRPRYPRHHGVTVIGVREVYVQPQRVWVDPHWEWAAREVWIPERWERVYVPPAYEPRLVNGRQVIVQVRPARYEQVFHPGYWEVVWDWAWVPGHWQTVN